jgi:hypothetical protein
MAKILGMNHNLGKCGCDCTNCPTYRDNIRTVEERIKCSKGWSKYLNIKLSPEKLRACDGCSLPDSNRKVYYLNCSIRKCCIENNIKNCAYCTIYPCEELKSVHSIVNIQTKNEFTDKTGKSITKDDYIIFIEPYAGIKHLNKHRNSIQKSEIKDYKKYSIKIKFIDFPEILLSKNEAASFKRIHSFLTSIEILKDISYARYMSVKKRRELLLKTIWTIALFGEFKETNRTFLELDPKTFLSQKIYGMYDRLKDSFKALEEYNIYCDIIPLDTNKWLTPTGGLRNEGWKIVMSFGSDRTDINTLETFKKYVKKLNDKYKNKAYAYFNRADLSPVIE